MDKPIVQEDSVKSSEREEKGLASAKSPRPLSKLSATLESPEALPQRELFPKFTTVSDKVTFYDMGSSQAPQTRFQNSVEKSLAQPVKPKITRVAEKSSPCTTDQDSSLIASYLRTAQQVRSSLRSANANDPSKPHCQDDA